MLLKNILMKTLVKSRFVKNVYDINSVMNYIKLFSQTKTK